MDEPDIRLEIRVFYYRTGRIGCAPPGTEDCA